MDQLYNIIIFGFLIYNGAIVSTVDILPERVELVNSTYVEGCYNFSRCRIHRFNRTMYVFEAEFEVMVDLNEEFFFELHFHYNRLGNNQYSKMPYGFPKMPFCAFLEKYYKAYVMNDIKTISNLPQLKRTEPVCPFKKVYFHIINIQNTSA